MLSRKTKRIRFGQKYERWRSLVGGGGRWVWEGRGGEGWVGRKVRAMGGGERERREFRNDERCQEGQKERRSEDEGRLKSSSNAGQ